MGPTVTEWLFPDPPRDFPARRMTRTLLRAVHVLCGGVLLGGYVFAVTGSALSMWWYATVVSGGLLFATDLHASCAVLIEVRGLVVVAKLALLLMLPATGELATWLLAAVLLIGAVSSHLPGRYRHMVIFLRDRVSVDTRKG